MRRNEIRRCRPPETAIAGWYAGADLLDAYCLVLPNGAPRDARMLARLALSDPSWVFRRLMALRDRVVAPLGIKSSDDIRAGVAGDTRIDFFPVLLESADEVVVGEDDRHLDFRTSLAIIWEGKSALFVSTTAVRCHNRMGRLYLAIIRPFHVGVVKAGLHRVAKQLRQTEATGIGQTHV